MNELEQDKDDKNSAVTDTGCLKTFLFGALKYILLLVILDYFFDMDPQGFVFFTVLYFLMSFLPDGDKYYTKMDKNIYEDAADVIERFLDGTCGAYEWDDLLSRGMNGDYRYIEMQRLLDSTRELYPSTQKSEWCSAEGRGVIKKIGELIRNSSWTIEELRECCR